MEKTIGLAISMDLWLLDALPVPNVRLDLHLVQKKAIRNSYFLFWYQSSK
jgi:hypothetical protein